MAAWRSALLVWVGVLLAACGTAATASAPRPNAGGLVGYPSYLPASTLHWRTDATLVGTAARPALTSEGDPVEVRAGRWSALAVVTGPAVPGEGLSYQSPTTTCTWTVTISHATAPVSVRVSDFDVVDAHGDTYHPYLVAGQRSLPRTVEPGRTLIFQLRAVEAVGEGLMRWAPNGRAILAKWDFVVEND